MTEPRAMEPFEARLGELVRAYTNAATDRPFDARAVSQAALSTRGAAGWVGGTPGWRIAGAPWAAALAAVVVVAVVAIAILRPPSDPATEPIPTATAPATFGPIPQEILHAWQRPYAVTPGLDEWGSGYLDISNGDLAFRPSLSDPASRSTITASGADKIVATATGDTANCTVGDVGEYGWTVEGSGTVMTLTAYGLDACAARTESLVGDWVRATLPQPGGGDQPLARGSHATSAFDPFGYSQVAGQLSFTVPEDGWSIMEDRQATLGLLRDMGVSDPAVPFNVLMTVLAGPRVAADFEEGAACDSLASDAAGVGTGVDDIVSAITARASVVADPPKAVTIGGYDGRLLDLRLAPTWTGGCVAVDGRQIAASVLLKGTGAAPWPVIGLSPDVPIRLIVLDLGDDRTIVVAIACFGTTEPEVLEAGIDDAMEVIESFEFHPPGP